jgi:esterase
MGADLVQGPRMPSTRFAVVNGLCLHYRETGSANGFPVVVLHGIMGHSREWDPLIEALAVNFRVYAPDARGHGESDWATEYSLESMADDLAGLLQQLQLSPVHLVGHSMGAIAALLVAAGRPNLVERLVLIDIGPDSLTSQWVLRELNDMLSTFADAQYEHSEDAVGEWLAANPRARPGALRHYVKHNLRRRTDGRYVWLFDAGRLGMFLEDAQAEWRLWKALDLVRAPTLVIRGADSDVLSPATADQMVRSLADGTLWEIPEAGHDIGVEQPAAATEAVLKFLPP